MSNTTTRTIPIISSCLLGLLLLVSTIFHASANISDYKILFTTGVCMGAISILSLLSVKKISITTTDILVFIYAVYLIFSAIYIVDIPTDPLFAVELFILASLYVCGRLTSAKGKQVIVSLIVASGVVQALLGLAQYFGFTNSNHAYFAATGSFFNPGPLGGYLAACISLTLPYIFKRLRERDGRWYFFSASSLIMTVTLILSNSRAAWLSLIIVLVLLAVTHSISSRKKRLIATARLIIPMILIVLSLYKYKEESASGRLFIWKVSTDMISEKPIFGHGAQSFPSKYMLYQGKYFEDNPHAPEATSASNNYYAFNEFIRITSEQGVIGLLLFISILTLLFLHNRKHNIIIKSGLITLIVFSCFSYPSNILPLKMLFTLFIGLLAGGPRSELNLKPKRILVYTGIILTTTAVSMAVIKNREYKKAYDALEAFSEDRSNLDNAQYWYARMKNDRFYVRNYSKTLYRYGHYETCLPVMEKAAELAPSSLLLCQLGDNYKHLGMFENSENMYFKASSMTPGYATPLHSLLRLYMEMEAKEKAEHIAEKILITEFKIVNSIVLRARDHAKNYLNITK